MLRNGYGRWCCQRSNIVQRAEIVWEKKKNPDPLGIALLVPVTNSIFKTLSTHLCHLAEVKAWPWARQNIRLMAPL